MQNFAWETEITQVEPNKILLRGYPIDELAGRVSFSHAIFLAIKGRLPTENEAKMIDAILVSSIDHGVTPPSCLAARAIASTGSSLKAAVAGGILAISRLHGGAIEESMTLFQHAVDTMLQIGRPALAIADDVIKEYLQMNRRLPGYGHRYHNKDPRTLRLFALSTSLGMAGDFVEMARAIESQIEIALGKRLPINVDGAIAALLCEMGFPARAANGFFIMARVPGLIAHVLEEQTRMKPMRHIDTKAHVYDGPPERSLDKEGK
jgi:citrate synthase